MGRGVMGAKTLSHPPGLWTSSFGGDCGLREIRGRAPILTVLWQLQWNDRHGATEGSSEARVWSHAQGANIQGSWSAPSQGASWEALQRECGFGMVLSAFPGQEQILPWQVQLRGLPEFFSAYPGGPWFTQGFLKEVV